MDHLGSSAQSDDAPAARSVACCDAPKQGVVLLHEQPAIPTFCFFAGESAMALLEHGIVPQSFDHANLRGDFPLCRDGQAPLGE
jgi:hypothetical protein